MSIKKKIEDLHEFKTAKERIKKESDPICKCGINWSLNKNIPNPLQTPQKVTCEKCGFTIEWFVVSYLKWGLIKESE